jgi:hypothetical protein
LSKPANPPSDAAKPGLDALKVPTGAVLIICKEVQDALKLIPEGVVLAPEKYKALMDRIEQLERLASPGRPETPSTCKLTGQVDGDLVRIQTQFEFRTDRDRAVVGLGCQRAWPKPGATLDGQLPMLLAGDDGLTVQVEKTGVHQMTLELEVLLASKGTKGMEQGFDLGLPQAAITMLEQLTLPRAVTEVRVNGRAIRTKPVDAQHSRLEALPLGAADHLELAWKGPAAAQKGPPLVEVNGRLNVRVDDARVTSDVELNLQVLRGETKQWRIQLPPQVIPDVREPRLPDDRIEAMELPDAKNPIWTIRMKEPSAEPLRVVFQVRQPWAKTAVAVGPFPVLDADRQWGTIKVTAPPDYRVKPHLRGDVNQRDLNDEPRRDNAVADFTYWSVPVPPAPGQPLAAALELEVEPFNGAVESRIEHTLMLTDQGWRVTTRVNVRPIHTKLDMLEIQVPANYQVDREIGAAPADLVESVEVKETAPKRRVAHIKLFREQTQPFAVTLAGLFEPAGAAAKVSLELPVPLGTLDRGGSVAVALPEGLELVSSGSTTDPIAPGERQHTWRSDRFPMHVDVGWRPYRPELPVEAIIDLNVGSRPIMVTQRLRFQLPPTRPTPISLLIPGSLAGGVRLQGGTLGSDGALTLTPTGSKEHSLLLTYALPHSWSVPEGNGPSGNGSSTVHLPVPLVRLAQATRAETKVRVWTDPGVLPVITQGAWEERPIEIVPDQDSLPALVLRTASLDIPLTLGLTEAAYPPLAPIVIDRALIQVSIHETGTQSYRARFLISRLAARQMDVLFPEAVAQLNPEIWLGGKKLTRWQTIDGDTSQAGMVARLAIEPALYRQTSILEVRYRLTHQSTWNGAWQTGMWPPVLRGEVFLGLVRWQVEMPAGWMPLYRAGGYTIEQGWVWRGGLLAPRPPINAGELETWLTAGTDADAMTDDTHVPSLVAWRMALEPFVVLHLPEQLWLLGCSLLLLLLGVALSLASRSRRRFWGLAGATGLGLAGVALWWPSGLPAIVYGSEPGAAVLAAVLSLQWMLHQRYRRQVVFLPAFTRLKAGSSLVRKEGGSRPHGEPSTIDAPAKRDSGAKQPA